MTAKKSPPFNRMSFYLREYRKSHGWTQEELAERADMLKSTISMLENRQSPINERHLYIFADIFGVEPLDLLTRNPASDTWSDLDKMMAHINALPLTKHQEVERILRAIAEPEAAVFEGQPED